MFAKTISLCFLLLVSLNLINTQNTNTTNTSSTFTPGNNNNVTIRNQTANSTYIWNITALNTFNNYSGNSSYPASNFAGQSCGKTNPQVASDCWMHSYRDNSCCFRTVNGNNNCLFYGYNVSCCDNYINGNLVYCGSSYFNTGILTVFAILSLALIIF